MELIIQLFFRHRTGQKSRFNSCRRQYCQVCQYIIFSFCTGIGKFWYASTKNSILYWHEDRDFYDASFSFCFFSVFGLVCSVRLFIVSVTGSRIFVGCWRGDGDHPGTNYSQARGTLLRAPRRWLPKTANQFGAFGALFVALTSPNKHFHYDIGVS